MSALGTAHGPASRPSARSASPATPSMRSATVPSAAGSTMQNICSASANTCRSRRNEPSASARGSKRASEVRTCVPRPFEVEATPMAFSTPSAFWTVEAEAP